MAFQDIRKSRKWLSAEEIWLLAFVLLIVAGLLALNITLARSLPGGEWFFLRWSGARAFLVEQIGPYSTEIAQRVQELAYGRRAFSSEYGFVLNDPFYIVLLYTPLALLRDFTLARGIWMLVSEAALVGTVLFAFNLSEWQPPRWLYITLLGFGLFSYFSLNALITGTPAIILNFIYLWILLAIRSYSDELAGALLFLVAYQWEVGGLFFLFIIGAGLRAQRAKPITGVEGLKEETGFALDTLDPTGTVLVHGEIWNADAMGTTIKKGQKIRVKAIDNLRLKVELIE